MVIKNKQRHTIEFCKIHVDWEFIRFVCKNLSRILAVSRKFRQDSFTFMFANTFCAFPINCSSAFAIKIVTIQILHLEFGSEIPDRL